MCLHILSRLMGVLCTCGGKQNTNAANIGLRFSSNKVQSALEKPISLKTDVLSLKRSLKHHLHMPVKSSSGKKCACNILHPYEPVASVVQTPRTCSFLILQILISQDCIFFIRVSRKFLVTFRISSVKLLFSPTEPCMLTLSCRLQRCCCCLSETQNT